MCWWLGHGPLWLNPETWVWGLIMSVHGRNEKDWEISILSEVLSLIWLHLICASQLKHDACSPSIRTWPVLYSIIDRVHNFKLHYGSWDPPLLNWYCRCLLLVDHLTRAVIACLENQHWWYMHVYTGSSQVPYVEWSCLQIGREPAAMTSMRDQQSRIEVWVFKSSQSDQPLWDQGLGWTHTAKKDIARAV